MKNDRHDEPFHSGEVYYLWSYLYDVKTYTVALQVFMNHTEDRELQDFLDDVLENCFQEEEEQVEAILKEAGIRLPPAPPARPDVDVADIPAGARFNDSEIVLLVKKELMIGKRLCSYIMGEAVQDDLITLFDNFHSQRVEHYLKLIHLIKDKGWFVSPPVNIK